MMRTRTKILLVFSVCVALVAIVAIFRARQSGDGIETVAVRPAAVRCVDVQIRPYRVTESFYGKLEANVRLDMAFQIAGRVVQLGPTPDRRVLASEKVTKGQLIARIDPERYMAAVAQAEAQTEQAKATLAKAEAGIADAKATLADAERHLRRVADLVAETAANPRDLEKAQLARMRAVAGLDAANAQYASAAASYRASESSVKMSKINLADAILRAPMDAVVANTAVEIGEMVQAGQTVMSLVDLSSIKLVIGVFERKLPLIKAGQMVSVDILALQAQARFLRTHESLARPRDGRVLVVPPAADPADGLFKVEVELDNQDGTLHPGMVAHAILTILETEAVAIPADVAVRIGDKAHAFFIANDLTDPGPGATFHAGLDAGTVAHRVEFEPEVFDRDFYLVPDLPRQYTQLIVEGFRRLSHGQPVDVIGRPIMHQSADVRRSEGTLNSAQ